MKEKLKIKTQNEKIEETDNTIYDTKHTKKQLLGPGRNSAM